MPAPALALPLLVSFAEAAGITISAIATAAGIDTLSKKVEEYVEENPEQSQKILAMIMPAQGIANILKNESDDGEEVSETEVEIAVEEKPKLTGKEKGMRMRQAALQKKGNYSSPDAEGNYESKRGRMIRTAEELGLADPDLKDNNKKSNFINLNTQIARIHYIGDIIEDIKIKENNRISDLILKLQRVQVLYLNSIFCLCFLHLKIELIQQFFKRKNEKP